MSAASNPLALALGHLKSGRIREAELAISAVLARAADHPDALHLLGLVRRRQGRPKDATELFRRSLAANARQPHVWNALGGALRASGESAEARRAYAEALRLDPKLAEAAYNDGLTALDRGETEDAIRRLDAARRIKPDFADAHDAAGIAYLRANDVDNALAIHQRAVALSPNTPRFLHNLAAAQSSVGDPQSAAQSYAKVVGLAPNIKESWNAYGYVLFTLGRVEEAAAAYRKALAIDPGYLAAHQNLAGLIWETGDADRFLASYDDALRRAPNNANLLSALTDAELSAGRHDAAERTLRRLEALPGHDPQVSQYLRARLTEKRGDLEEAAALYERAAGAGGDPEPKRRLSEVALRLGREAQAAATIAAVLDVNPYDQEMLAFKTLLDRIIHGRHEQALEEANRFVSTAMIDPPKGSPDLPTFLSTLSERLDHYHQSNRQPLYQSVRGGTQTPGALFNRQDPVIRALRDQIWAVVKRYISTLSGEAGHAFLGRRARNARLAGSWSVSLQSGGFHSNHIHSAGWISSAFYVELPPDTADGERKAGWFKVGESNIGLGQLDTPLLHVKPEPGMLVLFPSYFWHGTVPFQDSARRLTAAFDVVPS